MKALLPLLLVLASVLLVLAILAALTLGLGIAEPLVPDSESVVQNFVEALAAKQYESAQAELSDEIKDEWDVQHLKQLDQALQNTFGEYEFSLGGQQDEQGDQANYQARIKTLQQGLQEINFELEQDPKTHLWKISSLDELEQAGRKQSGLRTQ